MVYGCSNYISEKFGSKNLRHYSSALYEIVTIRCRILELRFWNQLRKLIIIGIFWWKTKLVVGSLHQKWVILFLIMLLLWVVWFLGFRNQKLKILRCGFTLPVASLVRTTFFLFIYYLLFIFNENPFRMELDKMKMELESKWMKL